MSGKRLSNYIVSKIIIVVYALHVSMAYNRFNNNNNKKFSNSHKRVTLEKLLATVFSYNSNKNVNLPF